ncbi:hypothetical protein KC878_04420 [Candidatus Saccharibacteria bacterium]|nr:hypothetical protein [Candidatus Saccharibacteria bacterium]MCB9821445.1 hypothetical protein [Candidatus Nomurabacteria bacterium]
MTKRNLIILGLAISLLIGSIWGAFHLAGWILARRSDPLPAETVTVNPYAKISAEGYPLPSEAKESLYIELTDSSTNAAYSKARILYDYQTGNYEIVASDVFGVLDIIHHDKQFFENDPDTNEWYEIGAAEAQKLFDVSAVYFTQDMVDAFLKTAIYMGDFECDKYRCASWQGIYGYNSGVETLTIRVNNTTRKIYDINGVGEDITYTVKYRYQPVDIKPPDSYIKID